MSTVEFVRQIFGPNPDPFADPDETHRPAIERIVALWSNASRSDLRTFARLADPTGQLQWKCDAIAKTLARLVLTTEGRRQQAALVALRAFCPQLDPLTACQ